MPPRPAAGGRPSADGPPAPARPQAHGSRSERGAEAHPGSRRDPGRPAAERATGSSLRGALAVLGMFLATLAGCGADSFVDRGLGTITLVALAVSAAAAALLVRRRDLSTVLVAPPLVFVGVAVVNILLAPSASLSLVSLGTLLIQGFPTMAIATAVALVLVLVRLAARR